MANAPAGKAKDYVIATGVQHSVRTFISWSALELGVELEFRGRGKEKSGL